MNTVAERITKVMKDKNISYRELEKRTGISKSTLQRYTNDVTKGISIDKLKIIAKALDVAPEHLLGWDKPTSTIKVKEGSDVANIVVEMMDNKDFYNLIIKIYDMTPEQRGVVKTLVDNIK